jgi:tetratricopeptide (TPR) repeat protein
VPRPDLSVTLGTPSACDRCHGERGAQWAADSVAAWYPQRKPGFQSFAGAFSAADRGDPSTARELASLIDDAAQSPLVRASALARARTFPTKDVIEATGRALADSDALLRAAAAETLVDADPATRAELLPPLLRDPVRLVRMAAARSLAGEPEGRLLGDERAAFPAALDEWVAAQRFNADRPEALTNLGTLSLARGRREDAVAAFRRAIALDPAFVQASVNLADTERTRGDEAAAEKVLRQALARDPRAGAAHHALGLALVRQGRRAEALASLKAAHELAGDDARFAFVYAVALHDAGNRERAVTVLRDALGRHPWDRDLVETLAAYEDESR